MRVSLLRQRIVVIASAMSIVMACGANVAATPTPTASPIVSGSALAATTVPGCIDCVVRIDAVLAVTFAAPRAFSYVPAKPAQTTELVLTETARLSSYPLGVGPRDASDVLIELFLAPRRGQDLSTIASTRFSTTGATTRTQTVAGRSALRLEGEFQSGKRAYVLVEVDPDRVLVLSALPLTSTRIGDFERLLQTLTVR